VLTITRASGSAVSGKVSDRTVLECPAATASPASHGDSSSSDSSDDRGRDGVANQGPGNAGQDDPAGHDAGDDNGGDKAEHCTTAALVARAIVREAKLRTSGADATWLKIELGS